MSHIDPAAITAPATHSIDITALVELNGAPSPGAASDQDRQTPQGARS